MRRKLLAVLLGTTMMMTALAGCGAKEEAAAPAAEPADSTKAE